MDQQIRLFVSSTFLDMQGERNELARSCFPAARRLFATAGVSFTEIDLRWGLPLNSPETRIAGLCRAEVARCRGYFIGILGGRYGTVHASVDATRSMTEIEICAGAFEAPPSSFIRFYFRHAAVDDVLALSALKGRIRERFNVKEYETPESLSAMILADLAALARTMPPATDHAFGLLARMARAGVGRRALTAELDAFLQGKDRMLRVLGPSGSGKSILLAGWFDQRQGTWIGPRTPIWQRIRAWLSGAGAATKRQAPLWLMHCAGEQTRAGGLSSMLDALGNRLRAALDEAPPASPLPLKDKLLAFHRLLGRVAALHEGVILVIDDVDALHLDPVLPFHWLPPDMGTVKLVLSGRTSGFAAQLGDAWRTLDMPDFSADEGGLALTQYLEEYGKGLEDAERQRMMAAGYFTRPLALRLAADELRLAEEPAHLETLADALARVPDARGLFAHLLERLEAEHGRAAVSAICGLLACSRGGLWEPELRALLRAQIPLPASQWSTIMLVFSRSVVDHDGRYALHFDELYGTVHARYLHDPQVPARHRRQLIAWLDAERRQAQAPPRRVVEELPWQLCQARDWQGLLALLLDEDFFMACWTADPSQAVGWWRRVESHCGVKAPAAWHDLLARPDSTPALHAMLGLLFAQLGHPAAAADCACRLAARQEPGTPSPAVAANLLNLSGFLMENRETATAADTLRLAAALLPAHGDDTLRASYLNARGNLRKSKGEHAAAALDYQEAERLHAIRHDELAAAQCRHNRALAMLAMGDHAGARKLLERCIVTFHAVHDIEALAQAWLSLARAFERHGKLKRALASVSKAESLARARGDGALLCDALGARARLHELSGDRDGAESAYLECEGIHRGNGDLRGEIDTLLARVKVRLNLGPRGHDAARHLLAKAASMASAGGSKEVRESIASMEEILRQHTREEWP